MKKLLLSLSLILILCFTGAAFAIDDFTVSESNYDEGPRVLSLMINDNRSSLTTETVQSGTMSLGGMDLENVSFTAFSDEKDTTPITFYFIVDTTTTHYEVQQKLPSKIAGEIYNLRQNKNDEYYLITFDTDVHKADGPYTLTSDSLSNLTYAAAGTNYKAALNYVAELLEKDKSFTKKVIILITDGRLQDASGKDPVPEISLGSLKLRLRDLGYPIYVCGITEQYEEPNIDKAADRIPLEEISAETGGLYRAGTVDHPGQNFMNHIGKSGILSGTVSTIYGKETAGAETVAVTLSGKSRQIGQINYSMDLPLIQGPTPTPEPTDTPTPEPADTFTPDPTNDEQTAPLVEDQTPTAQATSTPTQAPPTATPEPTATFTFWENIEDKLQSTLGDNWKLILVAGVLLIALIVLVILTFRKKKEEEPEKIPPDDDPDPKPIPGPNPFDGQTVVGPVNPPVPPTPEPVKNAVKIGLKDRQNGKLIETVITSGQSKQFGRLHDPMPKDFVVMGVEKVISRMHLKMAYDGNNVILEDTDSANGTWVNNREVGKNRVILTNGSVIRIGSGQGEREYSVFITPQR